MNSEYIQISGSEFSEVLKAYNILTDFVEKIIKSDEIYTKQFLDSMLESELEIKNGELKKVDSFEEFIN